MAFGTWHKVSLINRKQALLAKVQAGQEALEANDALAAELTAEYESFRPLFASQQNTLDTLQTLALLQQSRSNRSFWYVLLADQQTYFSQPPGPPSTNKPPRTNLFATVGQPSQRRSGRNFPAASAASTNLSPAKPGLIAELCIPEDADGARQIRRQLVDELKEQRLFSKVDLLSDDLRRNLADPKVIIPDRDFVLGLDFAETEFQQPLPPRKPLPGGPSRATLQTRGAPLVDGPGKRGDSQPDCAVKIPFSEYQRRGIVPLAGLVLAAYYLFVLLPLAHRAEKPGRTPAKGLAEALGLPGPDQHHRH